MKKELLLVLTGIILVSAIVWWQYDSNVDVSITKINAPRTLGVDAIRTDHMNEIELIIQNNGSKPIEIELETENAFVNADGESVDTFIVFGRNSDGFHYSDYISTQDKIKLEPGENRLTLLLAYQVTGEQNVHIKVVNNEIVLDEKSFTVDVMPPELSVELDYDMIAEGELEVYNINSYVMNNGLGRAESVEANLSIIDPTTGKVIASEIRDIVVPAYSKSPFSTWKNSPDGVIELSSTENSDKSYMPAQAVVKGRIGKQYIVKLTATWQDQTVEKQIMVPRNSIGEEVE